MPATLPHLVFSDLRNKTAAITGGAGVLCTAFAEALSSAGVKLALLDLNETAAKQSAERITAKTSAKAVGVACDVLSKESLERALEIINPITGPIDILINGAGGNAPNATTAIEQLKDSAQLKDSFYNLELEGFKAAFDLNFIGTLLPTQVLSRDMVERKQGVIINISSMNAFKPLTKIPAYSAAKSAVSNFTRMASRPSCSGGNPGQRHRARVLFDETTQISGL